MINILSVMFSTPKGRFTKAVCKIENHRSFDSNHSSIPWGRQRHWWTIHSRDILQNGSESINKIIIRKIVISIPGAKEEAKHNLLSVENSVELKLVKTRKTVKLILLYAVYVFPLFPSACCCAVMHQYWIHFIQFSKSNEGCFQLILLIDCSGNMKFMMRRR